MRILILDHQNPYRIGTQKLLEIEFPELTVDSRDVSEISDFDHIIETDILLIDPNRISHLSNLKEKMSEVISKGCNIVIYSASISADFLVEMLSIGIKGILLKHSSPTNFMIGISKVMKGESYIDSDLVPLLLTKVISNENEIVETQIVENPNKKAFPEDILSKTEWTILQLFIQGKSNSEIASSLFLSESTVSQYMGKISKKLKVPNRTAAAVKAVANGWIDVSEYVI
ncbi:MULTISPECIES: response regulator transcription factor [Metabacillus]|uniref:response regulator transcription factor n=1 Tax=Metabacillus TaxID=2675233 RepID=UPI000C7FAA94|nr:MULTISPECIES: response regulator transcription factor [Metabacillus]